MTHHFDKNYKHKHKHMSMSRFSGVLQLTDLDDFIAPSQAICMMFHKLGYSYLK